MPPGVENNNNPALKSLENLRKRLLDLTARNRLDNFRHTKGSSLRIIDELPNQLAETLLTEKEMRFLPIPEPTREQLVEAGYIKIDEESGQENRLKNNPNAEEWARQLGFKTSYDVPLSSNDPAGRHTDNAIQTLLFPYELETRLRNLRQKAESAIEETGANILYLGFGFLEWFDNTDSDKGRFAPLFLLPTRLQKDRLSPDRKTYEYILTYSGEDIIPNLSLREKLRADFALVLPDLDENTRPEEYFESVSNLIHDNQPRWRLCRHISLTLLNFSKLLMYLDLDPTRWPEGKCITNHSIVSRFLMSYNAEQQEENKSEPDFGFGEEYLIDELDEVHERYPLIDDADSSQHSALVDAIDGKNLVIEGPPGTGKSQTITNLIAAAMAQGKKVLFVAEKLAALEIVKRRLDIAGLGEFCLELHSHKSQKRKLLDNIGERLKKHGNSVAPEEIDADIVRYEELKNELKEHVGRINRTWKSTGKTAHEILMAATRYREALGLNPEMLHPVGYDGENFDAARQRRTRDKIKDFGNIYQSVKGQLNKETSLQSHPWYGVRNTDLQVFDIDRVSASLENWQKSLRNLLEFRPELAAGMQCEQSEIPESLNNLKRLLDDLERLPMLNGNELLDILPVLKGQVLENTVKLLKFFKDIQKQYLNLSKYIGAEILEDLSVVDRFLRGSQQLQQLVGATVELGNLTEVIQRLQKLQDKLSEIEEPVSGIRFAIGENTGKFLALSERGIRELRVFVKMVADLQPGLWKMRDELFDNDELDQALPTISSDLESINKQCRKLEGTFFINSLPDQTTLQSLGTIIATGGVFRWFKGSWRSARKQLLGYAANPQIKLQAMLPLLELAEAFSKDRKKFESNANYRELLGKYYKDLDTDIASLISVREWYKCVRQNYGIGFGAKVSLGEAIIHLPDGHAKAIRSMSERGIDERLESILDDIDYLKGIFSPSDEFHEGAVMMTESEGVIRKLLESLKSSLNDCGQLLSNKNISLNELLVRVDALDKLRIAVVKWNKAELNKRLFKGRLKLTVGLGADNQVSMAMAENTLRIATILDQDITENLILTQIYEALNDTTFDTLASLSGQLRIFIDQQLENYTDFEKLVSLDSDAWSSTCSGDSVERLIEKNKNALDNDKALQFWIDYVRVRDQLTTIGFVRLADAVERGDIQSNKVECAYYAGIYDFLAREIFREQPELSRFSGRSQESLQRQFRDYDNNLKKLQRKLIAWKIDQNKVPIGKYGGRVSEYTEASLLEHEYGKKARHIPIRQLLSRASKALVGLKPCFMMGPMSVAQYLAPGQIDFDLVVMDEASQIKPEDALGSIARGAQLVVVGDPKQLPPTSFFDRIVNDDEEDPTALEESESILDATLPMFTARRLRWHYRSQHQSLIAFSNESFYENNLVLFPSPHNESEDYGIQYSRVRRGCFVNRRNFEEAKIISESVREHFRHRPDETLGVVAMNAEQRDQIERSVEVLAKEDAAFQAWLEKDQLNQESLFIKNLENVQGDERDVIFISMTYGPQEPGGNVYQRFGPINLDVGWRRLNVLFTRSRKRMHVFTSMGSEDIVVGAASKRGVEALRDFLAFSETGILHRTKVSTNRPPDSDFEIAVADALKKDGFTCVPQVGVAGFFIDIAVVDPGNPGRYLMGIECDGATYHSAKSARDRDRLRQAILERLGWNIRRIWSTDWFKNPKAELQPILRELNELKSEPLTQLKEDIESEVNEIEEIIENVEEQEAVVEHFITDEVDLREKLLEFDRKIIRKNLPNTPENKRILRPAMLEALLEYMPTSKWEFLEMIPLYLRQSIESDEGTYLEQIFEIINSIQREGQIELNL